MKLVKRVAVVVAAVAALLAPTLATASAASADGGGSSDRVPFPAGFGNTGDDYYIGGF
jgi:hypothetical protein